MNSPPGNPFSTRHVQPGALAYVFPPGVDADQLVNRLRHAGWRGQLLGPHGVGKTTLLHSLQPALRHAGRHTSWHTLHGGQTRLPKGLTLHWDHWNQQTQVIVDGYEQLGWYARWQLSRKCRQTAAGLLVTSHTTRRLPIIHNLEPALTVTQQLVDDLMQGHPQVLDDQDVASCFQTCAGNVRETLFALYDLYEMRRRI